MQCMPKDGFKNSGKSCHKGTELEISNNMFKILVPDFVAIELHICSID